MPRALNAGKTFSANSHQKGLSSSSGEKSDLCTLLTSTEGVLNLGKMIYKSDKINLRIIACLSTNLHPEPKHPEPTGIPRIADGKARMIHLSKSLLRDHLRSEKRSSQDLGYSLRRSAL